MVALEVGLTTPDTIYTNDTEEIRSFLRQHGGTIVYKPFMGLPWRSQETSWVPYTSLLREDQLAPDAVLRSVPGIYQELVPKAYELRVTVIGNRAFGAKILSQQTEAGKLDWRKAYAELEMRPCELPATVHGRCLDLLKRLGLVFGCFDFIVTPAGECVFLEVNEMGQFLFVEEYTGLPLLDAFTELLLQGTVDFVWSESQAGIRYVDVLPNVEEGVAASRLDHVKPPEQVFREDE
jgi:glutathione synthase/RimK-type ligase-like ATP-grasp enzyme